MRSRAPCVTLLTVLQTVMFSPSSADNGNTTTVLSLQRLLANYDPLELPVANSSQQVSLNMSMGLKGFIELDMKKQTLVSFGWLTVTWYDQFLRWDLEQFPFRAIYPYADMVWRPDLVIFNTVSDLDQLEKQKTKVIVEHTGKVTWYPGGLFQTFCSINIFRYPLDTQVCSVQVSSWAYDAYVLNAILQEAAYETAYKVENHPEWTLVTRTASYTPLPSNYWTVNFNFTLKRKVMFYILNMIFPIFLLSFLSCLVFLLPADSGEKMTVSVTIFLSFAVFLSLINNSLPTNSDSVCLFSVYVAVQMFISVCSIVTAACIVFMDGKSKESNAVSKISHDMSSDFCTNSTETVTNPMSVSRWSIWNHSSVFGSESSGFSLPGTESLPGTSTNGRKKNQKNHDVSSPEQQNNLSVRQVWLELIRFHDLSPHQRRRLSRQLDCVCMKLSLIVNCLTCLVFSLLWIFT
ncbi:hypothetical protein ACOMHN_027147 [Nucella lapillus]